MYHLLKNDIVYNQPNHACSTLGATPLVTSPNKGVRVLQFPLKACLRKAAIPTTPPTIWVLQYAEFLFLWGVSVLVIDTTSVRV